MLTEQTQKLEKELEDLKAKRIEEAVNISKLGSVAEATIMISGVMDNAQKAADLYTETAKKRADEIAEKIIEDANTKAAEIIRSAEKDKEDLFDS